MFLFRNYFTKNIIHNSTSNYAQHVAQNMKSIPYVIVEKPIEYDDYSDMNLNILC